MSSTDLAPPLAAALAEHSPRLSISRPTLVPSAASPTGWLLVIPDLDLAMSPMPDVC